MSDVGEIAAYLGIIVKYNGGEVRVPNEFVEEGLDPNQRIRVFFDQATDELVFKTEDVPSEQ
jgi:hypothetical protein